MILYDKKPRLSVGLHNGSSTLILPLSISHEILVHCSLRDFFFSIKPIINVKHPGKKKEAGGSLFFSDLQTWSEIKLLLYTRSNTHCLTNIFSHTKEGIFNILVMLHAVKFVMIRNKAIVEMI